MGSDNPRTYGYFVLCSNAIKVIQLTPLQRAIPIAVSTATQDPAISQKLVVIVAQIWVCPRVSQHRCA